MKTNKKQKNISDGWKPMKLSSLFDIRRGGSPRPINEFITTREDGLNWLKIGDIEKGAKYINTTSSKILKEGLSRTTLVKKGDFILSNSMSFGRPYILNIDTCIHDGWLTFQDLNLDLLNREFLYFLLLHPKTQNEFVTISAGSGVQNLKKETVSEVSLLFPPLLEQNRIVSVLETWDSGIEKLKRKIAIKKEIKKGLMQELLTGKKRLPGFDDKWEKVQIGELLDYEQPTNYIVDSTEYEDSYLTPVLTAGKTFILGYTNEENNIFPQGNLPVIIFDDFTTANKFVDFKFKVKSSAMKILSVKDNSISDIYFVYNAIQLLRYISAEHKRTYISEYQFLDISLPSIGEQKAIKKILKNSDQEIENLKKKLEYFMDQKKYLLNNLVTGQIRTPENLNVE